MKLEGEQLIAMDRDAIWAALNDPAVLLACIPGCKSLDKTGEHSFEAVVKQKIGPVSATFRGAVELTDLNPPESYTIVGEGKGGAAGFAKGSAQVRLEEADGGARLTYVANAKVGGKMAQLGGRLINGVARKLADQFFEKFKAEVEGAPEAEGPDGDAPSTVQETVAAGVAAVKETAAEIGDRASEAAGAAREHAADAVGKAREAASKAATGARTTAREAIDTAEERIDGLREEAGEFRDRVEERLGDAREHADNLRHGVKRKGFFGWLKGLFG